MRIKNLKLVFDTVNDEDKIIIVRGINNFENLILRKNPNEYKCIFSGTAYYFDKEEVLPLSLFLPLDDLKRNISKKKLKEFYEVDLIVKQDSNIKQGKLKMDITKTFKDFVEEEKNSKK